ncbi:hypothetical protein L596_005216 [Steinernema carpocapsae]|uniref:UDENN FNIP1/2-type domain-containing protein n=1 Tax=Steinernema carpocapsae TaxID=34508 RepID=A0A4U8UYJ1_STECR|nr:hypothetical protein L596_005216 [Steinernema carpocapsae]
MALLRSLFSTNQQKSKTKGQECAAVRAASLSDYCVVRRSQISKDDIRFLVFTENSYRLLFDTKSVIPVGSNVFGGGRLSKCGQYYFLRHSSDSAGIAQLVFGSMPTPAKSETLKIHRLKNCIMLTRVFAIQKRPSALRLQKSFTGLDINIEEQNSYTVRSTDTICSSSLSPRLSQQSLSCPDPPELFIRLGCRSHEHEKTSVSEMNSEGTFSPNKLSRHRRLNISRRSSICEEGMSHSSSRSRLSSCCSSATDSDNTKQTGIAVLIPDHLREFTFAHMPIVESEIARLEKKVAEAMLSKALFLPLIYEGWYTFCKSFCALHNAPRLIAPVWITLNNADERDKILNKFCATLAEIVISLDTKVSKYFVSTTLSSVLTNHMSWVASVTSPMTCSNSNDLIVRKNLPDKDLKTPYNCLLAQYLEISGSVGSDHREAKTVVIGDDVVLIAKMTFVLSYFIRCSSVACDNGLVEQNSQNSIKNTSPIPVNEPLNVDIGCGAYAENTLHSFLENSEEISQSADYSNEKSSDNSSFVEDRLAYIIPPSTNERSFEEMNLGTSLLAGVCPSFSEHFVLSGIEKTSANVDELYSNIISYVQQIDSGMPVAYGHENENSTRSNSPESNTSFSGGHLQDATGSKEKPETRRSSVFVISDISECAVKVITNEAESIGCCVAASPSEVIVSMLEQFVSLYKLGCAATFLISFLEDSLGAVLSKSISLVELLYDDKRKEPPYDCEETLDMCTAASVIGCDCSDLRMIVNVAAVFHPNIVSALK